MILPQNLHLKLRKSVKSRGNFGKVWRIPLFIVTPPNFPKLPSKLTIDRSGMETLRGVIHIAQPRKVHHAHSFDVVVIVIQLPKVADCRRIKNHRDRYH